MDPRLAELYGTNQPDQDDLEKMASAEFAEGLTEDGQIDLDNVSEEDLEEMAQEVLQGSDGDEDDEEGDEDMQKLSEADYLGRVMAHSYVNELRGIDKTSAEGKAGMFSRAGGWVKNKAISAHTASRKRHGEAWRGLKAGVSGIGEHETKGGPKMSWKNRAKSVGGAAWKTAPESASLLAAGGGTTYAIKRKKKGGKEKRSSAFDALATQRAQEILDENGGGEEVTKYDVLGAAVEQRALEILDANGYEVGE